MANKLRQTALSTTEIEKMQRNTLRTGKTQKIPLQMSMFGVSDHRHSESTDIG